jgi:hypothetical protein
MWPICHDCPYWEICEPPYICGATEQKIKEKNLNKFEEIKDDYEIKTIIKTIKNDVIEYIKWIIEGLNKLNKENYSKKEVKQILMSIIGEIITH